MSNAQTIGKKLQEVSQQLKDRTTEGSAGGGMVTVRVNGEMTVLSCQIEPALLEQNDRELLESLVTAATNQALSKARELHAEVMQEALGDVPGLADMPGLSEMLKRP